MEGGDEKEEDGVWGMGCWVDCPLFLVVFIIDYGLA